MDDKEPYMVCDRETMLIASWTDSTKDKDKVDKTVNKVIMPAERKFRSHVVATEV